MKKYLQKSKDEPLHKWIDRLVAAYNLTEEQEEMVREVAKQAYFCGSDVAIQTTKN